MASRTDRSEVVDLGEICARPTERPVRDLTPPDLRSMGALTTDLVGDESLAKPRRELARRGARTKLALVGVASAVVAVLAIVTVFKVRGASASTSRQPTTVAAAAKAPAPPAKTESAPAAPPVVVAAAPVAPPASNIKLPPPPTTGATQSNTPPPRAAFRSSMQAKPAPASAGPKMTKVQSTGVAGR